MYPAERQTAILKAAHAEDGPLSVARLSEELTVTPETIRRDLAVLERRGLITRIHGGAKLTHRSPFELSLVNRQAKEVDEKRRIVERTILEIPDEGVVLLDSGYTPLAIAARFPDRNLIVVTNNLPAIPLLLERPKLTVMALPGRLRPITQSAVDEWTRARLVTLQADLAIVGLNAISLAGGLMTTVPDEADVKRAMLACAKRRISAAIASKVGQTSFCRFGDVDDLDMLITDDRISASDRELLSAAGPEVVAV